MSRRPNQDPLPLHKPEACSKYCNGLLLRVDATYFKCLQGSFDGLFMGMEMRWSLTYVATPIAVAVREALFTSSDLINLTRRGAQSSFQCTASVCTACLGSTLPSWIVSALSAGMRLLRLAHSICDHSVLVLCFSGLCLRAPGRGEPGFRGGPCPGVCGFLFVFSDPGS